MYRENCLWLCIGIHFLLWLTVRCWMCFSPPTAQWNIVESWLQPNMVCSMSFGTGILHLIHETSGIWTIHSTLVVICVVQLLFVLFYVLCVNVYFHRVTTQLQLINISYHIIISYYTIYYIISYRIISNHIIYYITSYTTRLLFNVNKKVQLDATVCRHLFSATSLYMFRVSCTFHKTRSHQSGSGHGGRNGTITMTYTRGSRYSFYYSWWWVHDTRNMQSDVTENKCLHTVASSWTFINIESWCTEPCV